MEISLRLKAIANQVKYKTLADIGTDHGYVPIYLARKGLIEKAAACDVKPGPLMIAAENIKKHNLGGIIETRLGNGLKGIKPFEFETAVIAGMGGMLIRDILEASMECAESFKQLILQPQLDVIDLRRFLHKSEFKIDDEAIVFEDNKYYNILSCSKGGDCAYTEIDYMFGKSLIDGKSIILKNYISYKLNETNKILCNIDNSNGEKTVLADKRISELKRLEKIYNEVIKCL